MSFHINADIQTDTEHSSSYTVTHRDGLTIITGTAPLADVGAIIKEAPAGSVLALDLIEKLNAISVFGSPVACDAERVRLGLTEHPPEEIANLPTTEQVDAWLARGNPGASSKTIARFLLGQSHDEHGPRGMLPADMADFRRCSLLLAWAPALRDRLNELQGLSPAWGQLAAEWDALEGMLARGEGEALRDALTQIHETEHQRDIVDDFL